MPSDLNKEYETLGERMKKRREELGLSIHDVANEIQTAQHYISALEENNYSIFSAKVYARGFANKVIALLKLEEPERCLKEFDNEWDVQTFQKKELASILPENRGSEPLITPARIWIGLGVIAFILLLIFFSSRLFALIGAPTLVITEPSKNAVLTSPVVALAGVVQAESQLSVNGIEIRTDPEGNFDQSIVLNPGLHALEFVVEDKFERIKKELRYIRIH